MNDLDDIVVLLRKITDIVRRVALVICSELKVSAEHLSLIDQFVIEHKLFDHFCHWSDYVLVDIDQVAAMLLKTNANHLTCLVEVAIKQWRHLVLVFDRFEILKLGALFIELLDVDFVEQLPEYVVGMLHFVRVSVAKVVWEFLDLFLSVCIFRGMNAYRMLREVHHDVDKTTNT